MRPRLVLRRLLLPRSSKGRLPSAASALRAFTQNTAASARGRPQLPFLSIPSSSSSSSQQQQFRYFTTQRRQWLRFELAQAVKYTAYFWGIVVCVVAAAVAVQEELRERRHPTPAE